MPELEEKLLAAGGPQTQATRPSYVKFHDDKARPSGSAAARDKQTPVHADACCLAASLHDRVLTQQQT